MLQYGATYITEEYYTKPNEYIGDGDTLDAILRDAISDIEKESK